jgi:thioredoxin 1
MAEPRTTDDLITLTDQDLEATVRPDGRLVAVDFWAHGCPPCRMLARTLREVAPEFRDRVTFAAINTDDNPLSTMAYRVMATPTVLLFHRGAVVDAFVGARPKAAVRQFLLSHLESGALSQTPG